MPKTAIVCFRNDFRLEDNPALQDAILSGMEILPVFIYDELTWGEFGTVSYTHLTLPTIYSV